MKVHILDDWFDTLRTLPCFAMLAGHDVTVWTDHEPDPERLVTAHTVAQDRVLGAAADGDAAAEEALCDRGRNRIVVVVD